MPASLALVKTFWDGEARQRAVSLWSIGSWGGSGLCSLFGGFVAQNFGWRWIFFATVAVSLLGCLRSGYYHLQRPARSERQKPDRSLST
jgi:DHA2 family multidrug resistance protein-like MFS transporter